MARLIDADALIHSICNRCNDVNYDDPCEPGDCAFYYAVHDAPTVDAVPVVRCKDCKHGVWDEEEQLWECVVGADVDGDADTYALFHEYNEAEHFCSYGERRTDA